MRQTETEAFCWRSNSIQKSEYEKQRPQNVLQFINLPDKEKFLLFCAYCIPVSWEDFG